MLSYLVFLYKIVIKILINFSLYNKYLDAYNIASGISLIFLILSSIKNPYNKILYPGNSCQGNSVFNTTV